jgi:HSP20 family molecular chaperone IbpA
VVPAEAAAQEIGEERDSRTSRKGEAMAVMRLAGGALPPHANVLEADLEYVIELDVADFTAAELGVVLTGPQLTVRGTHVEGTDDQGGAFRLRESLEETFRLPDDVDLDTLRVHYRHGCLEIHAPKKPLTAREVPIDAPTALTGNPYAVPC